MDLVGETRSQTRIVQLVADADVLEMCTTVYRKGADIVMATRQLAGRQQRE